MSRPMFPALSNRIQNVVLAALQTLTETGYATVNDLTAAMVADGYANSSKSARRYFETYLPKTNLVEVRTQKLIWGKVNLVRLTALGISFARERAWRLLESEWTRLERLHEAEKYPEHAAMILVFAMRARERGCVVEVCPSVSGKFLPDVKVIMPDGTPLYVEVERHPWHGKAEKWEGLIALQGSIAAVTPSERSCLSLQNRLEKYGVPLYLTDLNTLRYPSAELWQ